MAAAIAASIRSMPATSLVMDDTHTLWKTRSQLGGRSMDRDRHCGTAPPPRGRVLERKTLNQFHIFFKASVSEFQAPSAICAYAILV